MGVEGLVHKASHDVFRGIQDLEPGVARIWFRGGGGVVHRSISPGLPLYGLGSRNIP